MPQPHDQSRYQVRLDWGSAGLARLAPAEVIVLVDVLAPADGPVALARVAADADAAVVLWATLRSASATADAIARLQEERGQRTSVSIIAAGLAESPDAEVRWAVEDLLGAGAVVDALAERGIDHSSPEAAVAGEGLRGLRPALRHLLTASAGGQQLIEAGHRDDVVHAGAVDADAVVRRFSGDAFFAASA